MTAKDLRRIRMPSSLLLRKLRPDATQRPAPAQPESNKLAEQQQMAAAQTAAAQPRLDLDSVANRTSEQAAPVAINDQPEAQSDTIKPRTPKQSLGALRTPQSLVNGVRPGTAWELPRGSQPVPVATFQTLHEMDEPPVVETPQELPVEQAPQEPEKQEAALPDTEQPVTAADAPVAKPDTTITKKTAKKVQASAQPVPAVDETAAPAKEPIQETIQPDAPKAENTSVDKQKNVDTVTSDSSGKPAETIEEPVAKVETKPAAKPATEVPAEAAPAEQVRPAKSAAEERPVEQEPAKQVEHNTDKPTTELQKTVTASDKETVTWADPWPERAAGPATQSEPVEPDEPIAKQQSETAPVSKPYTAPAKPVAQPSKQPRQTESAVSAVKPAAASQTPPRTITLPKLPRLPKLRLPKTAATTSPLTRNAGIFTYILVALAAAQIALAIQPAVGLYVNAASFAALVLLGMRSERSRQLAISAAILPLAMLVLLVLPGQTLFARTAEFMALLLVLGLTYRYLFTLDHPVAATRLRMTRYGLLFALPLMVVLGQILGLLGYGLLRNQYGFQGTPVGLVALSAVVFAVTEEIIFRGLIQQRAMRIFHPAMAAVLSALLFALFSIGHQGGALAPVFGALLGAVLAFIYHKKQNLLLTIAVNAAAKLAYVGLVLAFMLRG